MRESGNRVIGNRLIDGYDYHNQAWVSNGKYVRCGHPESMQCSCFGKKYEGYQTNCAGEEYFNGVAQ